MNRFFAIALCVAACGAASAQKANVDQANKLSGKADQLNQARNLIGQAIQNPETANDARTYFVAGKIEFDAYDNATKTQMINPSDPSAAADVMADELMNGYKYFLKALSLDSLPDAKGQVKPKYSKDIQGKLVGHANDFFNAGAGYYTAKKFYPQAYEAFVTYAGLPASGLLGKAAAIIPEDQIATAYYNAGLSAYQGEGFESAANAFKQARLNNYDQAEPYIYEIASWQTIANRDEARMAEAQKGILEAAEAGHAKFGLENPLFINNIINSYVVDGKIDDALAMLNKVISENPTNAELYGLRGYVYDRADNDDASEADYRKAASMEGVGFETLKNASKKIFRIGTKKWDSIEGASAEAAQARKDAKSNYFDVAKAIAVQAQAINADDIDLQKLLESIDYVLETYFNK